MKTKHLLFAMAAPLFVVACTNEELVENSTVQNLGELISTENIVLKTGMADAQSRMSFDGTTLKWQLGLTEENTDKLGLCHILDGKAQTNYKWMVSVLQSVQGNTYKVNDGGTAFDPVAIKPGDTDLEKDGTNNILYAYGVERFKTENATIFAGSYVAYYPYNTDFKDASATIPVNVASIQEATSGLTGNNYVGKYSFYVSEPFKLEGGDQEAELTMRQVLPILQFDLKNVGAQTVNVSKIEVSADGGMPVAAGINANLTSAVALSDIKVDASKNADSQLLVIPDGKSLAKDAEAKAFMTVMPGTYKNLAVKVILTDGSSYTKTIPTLSLSLKDLQPIALELDSDEMTIGDVYSQVTSAADLKDALDAAYAAATGQIDINVIKAFSVDKFEDILPTIATTKGAKITIKGEKITVTGNSNCTSASGLKNVTFANDVEFKGTYNNSQFDVITFAGNTTFKSALTVTDGSVMNIAGTATAEADVTVGNSYGNVATLNINEGGTLNMVGRNLTATQNKEHVINVEGTLNLQNNIYNTVGSELSVAQTSNIVKISGTVNVSSKSVVNITEGEWYVGNGTINNGGSLTAANNIVQALDKDEKPMALNNTNYMSATFSNYAWSDGKVNITNNGLYELTGCAITDLETIVKNEDNEYDNVNGINVNMSADYSINAALLDMSKYYVTFNVANNQTYTISIPAKKEWKVGTLNVILTNSANPTTVKIQSATNNEGEYVKVAIDNLNVVGTGADHANAVVGFTKQTNAYVMGTIGNLYVENATVESDDDNLVKCTTSPVTKGDAKVSLN